MAPRFQVKVRMCCRNSCSFHHSTTRQRLEFSCSLEHSGFIKSETVDDSQIDLQLLGRHAELTLGNDIDRG